MLETELLQRLHKAGARLHVLASRAVEVINGMKKNGMTAAMLSISLTKEAPKLVLCCQDAGMVHGCFMVGNLNEQGASMEKTLKFAEEASARIPRSSFPSWFSPVRSRIKRPRSGSTSRIGVRG